MKESILTMKLNLKIFLLLTVTIGFIFAAIPSGYYDSAAGLSGSSLRQELHNIIDGHTEKSYDYLWTAFATTDIRTSLGSDYIWCMYTELEFHHDEDQSSGTEVYTTYNREHSWPKSWANETHPHYTDLYHLYPTQAYANSTRNNLPYGEIEDGTATYTSENGSQRGDARTGLGYTGTVFEPIDEYKGDLARTYFYISTRYYTEDSDWDTSPMTNKCELLEWAVNMLLDWHHNDPVSQKELDRIEAVYAIQGNRNPFIDHPEYVDSIWASTSTSIDAPVAESATSVGVNGFTANWTSVSGATGYKLYVSQNSDFSSYVSGYNPMDIGNNLNKIIGSLSESTTYYYRVRAYNAETESANSNTISVTTSSSGGSTPTTVFSPGDIAITGINMDNPDQASIVFLVAVATGAEIKFTDNGWLSSNDWRTGEGIYTWTASQNYSVGDEIIIDFTSGPAFSTSGDQLIAYQNTSDMIAAVNVEGAHVWQEDATSSNTSALPQGLVNGSTCVALDEIDNIKYNRSIISGTKTEILAAINDYTNWTGDDSTPLTLSSSGFTVSDVPLPITLASFTATAKNGMVELSWETASEVNNARFIIYRDNEVIGSVEGSGTTTAPHRYTFTDNTVMPDMTYSYVLADMDYANEETRHEALSVIVMTSNNLLPGEFILGDAYPNPFNPTTIISLKLDCEEKVKATLHDLRGHMIRELQNGILSAGAHDLKVDGRDLSTGIYFVHVRVNDIMQVKKIALVK